MLCRYMRELINSRQDRIVIKNKVLVELNTDNPRITFSLGDTAALYDAIDAIMLEIGIKLRYGIIFPITEENNGRRLHLELTAAQYQGLINLYRNNLSFDTTRKEGQLNVRFFNPAQTDDQAPSALPQAKI